MSPLQDHPNEKRQGEQKGELEEVLGLKTPAQTHRNAGNQGPDCERSQPKSQETSEGSIVLGARAESDSIFQGGSRVRLGIIQGHGQLNKVLVSNQSDNSRRKLRWRGSKKCQKVFFVQ